MRLFVGVGELDGSESKGRLLNFNGIKSVACGILAACAVTSAAFPVTAANQVQMNLSLYAMLHFLYMNLIFPACFGTQYVRN